MIETERTLLSQNTDESQKGLSEQIVGRDNLEIDAAYFEEEPTDEELELVLAEFERDPTDYGGVDDDDIISLYMRDVRTTSLLTAEQEVDLAQRIERGREALLLSKQDHDLDEARRAELEQIAIDGDNARKHLAQANALLVIAMAKRYLNQGLPFQDLIQEGNLGLMRAVEKFDWRRGYKFSTYATRWVKQSITRGLADQSRTIRIPVHMVDRQRKIFTVIRRMEKELGYRPTPVEVAIEMGKPLKYVTEALRLIRRTTSLEKPAGEDRDSEYGQFIPDEEAEDPAAEASLNMLRPDLEEVMKALTAREEQVLKLRYGLLDGRVRTLKEVGKIFGVTRERIRQIEEEALDKLRNPHRRKHLVDYLG